MHAMRDYQGDTEHLYLVMYLFAAPCIPTTDSHTDSAANDEELPEFLDGFRLVIIVVVSVGIAVMICMVVTVCFTVCKKGKKDVDVHTIYLFNS